MKILVVGAGGREHAIVKKLRESAGTDVIYALPGNGGIARDAVCVPINALEIKKIRDFAVENKIDFAVVAPDDPLITGAADLLLEAGVPCFGPVAAAAKIEGSKIFAKELMKKYSIPTAEYRAFDDCASALKYVETAPLPLVVKADGPALGKGVVVAESAREAREAIISAMDGGKFGESGKRIVIEEFLSGPEASVLTFTDGETVIPMVSSMDHKRAMDDDRGPNTGGMGAVAPNPYYTEDVAKECMEKIFLPTVRAMKAEGRPFKGCLYFGLMLTEKGPKVIEYNCRFGDPEAQAVLPLLQSDLLEIMLACSEGRLARTEVKFSSDSSCCVVMASDGYPVKYEKGFEIEIPDDVKPYAYFAGVKTGENGKLFTNGGRVLGITAVRGNLPEAVKAAYEAVGKVSFKNARCRRDIGRKALEAYREAQYGL